MDKQKLIDATRMAQAFNEAGMSKCIKHKVGCVLTDQRGRIKGSGYNGTPEGHTNCDEHFKICHPEALADAMAYDLAELHRTWSASHEVHAEINVVAYTDRTEREGGTLYVTHRPCSRCAPVICASGVKRVVFAIGGMSNDSDDFLFKHSDVELVQMSKEEVYAAIH